MIVCPGYGITPTISNYAFVEKKSYCAASITKQFDMYGDSPSIDL